MVYVADPGAAAVTNAVLAALYVLWSAAWLTVGWHYGRAAYVSWRAAGGLWRRALAEILQPFAWALRNAVCRMTLFSKSGWCAVDLVPSPYGSGHMLRFAIFLGSLTPALWGVFLAVRVGQPMSAPERAVNIAGLAISILAAASHLLLAYKSRPKAWSNVIAFSVLWVLLAPVALVMLGAL